MIAYCWILRIWIALALLVGVSMFLDDSLFELARIYCQKSDPVPPNCIESKHDEIFVIALVSSAVVAACFVSLQVFRLAGRVAL